MYTIICFCLQIVSDLADKRLQQSLWPEAVGKQPALKQNKYKAEASDAIKHKDSGLHFSAWSSIMSCMWHIYQQGEEQPLGLNFSDQ